jgi:mce related protein.
MNQRRVLVICLAVVAIAGVIVAGWRLVERQRSLEFSLLFENAQGLEAGREVVYHGVKIGEVAGVQLERDGQVAVRVSVFPAHRNAVYREAMFVIERRSSSDGMQLTVKDGNGGHTSIEKGTVLQGTNGIVDEMKKRALSAFESVLSPKTPEKKSP